MVLLRGAAPFLVHRVWVGQVQNCKEKDLVSPDLCAHPPVRKFWNMDEDEDESPAPLVHWLCGLGLGLAGSPREIGSQRFPPYRAVGRIRRMCSWRRRAQQVSFGIAHGRLCYSLGLILSFQNSILNTGCPRIVEERLWRNTSQTHPQSFG